MPYFRNILLSVSSGRSSSFLFLKSFHQMRARANLCVRKNLIDSSVQAQSPGGFMRQNWRSYGNSNTPVGVSVWGHGPCCCSHEFRHEVSSSNEGAQGPSLTFT